MFEKLFVKTSDLVFHTIAPYAVERERFLAHCGEEGFSKVALRRIAGIVVTAACDLHAHGGLDVDQERLEAAAARIEVIRRQPGIPDDAREHRREFLRVTTRWVLFLGRLQPQAVSPRPYAALLDDFERWMTEERGLSRATLKTRRWHLRRFLDWLHERHAPVPDLSPRDLDGYLQHLAAQRLSRVSIKIHTNAVRAFIRHAERRGWCAAGLADTLHGPHIYRDNGLPIGPSWDDVNRLIQDAASDDPTDVRDRAILLLFLYNAGARADEAARLTVADLDLGTSPAAKLLGKGNKTRLCPLWPSTAGVLKTVVATRGGHEPVFLNRRRDAITRFGIYDLVKRHAARAAQRVPSIAAKRVSPHVIRHTTAVHLLRAGVDINTIRAWLGHVSLDTTNIYAEVDLAMKAKALGECSIPDDSRRHWRKEPGLMAFLRSL